MLEASQLSIFVLSATVLVVAPGPNTFYVTAQSLEWGRTAGILAVLGICLGDCIHTILAMVGLYTLLTTSTIAYNFIKYLGAAYLIYLGVNILLSSNTKKAVVSRQLELESAFIQGLLTCLLNPYNLTFFLTFLPQFLDPDKGSIIWQILFLSTVWAVINLIWFGLLAIAASSITQWIHHRPRLAKFQHWLAGGVLVGIGVRFVLP